MPYVTAVQFFQRYNFELADDHTKPEYVIAQQFRRHEVLFKEHPSALQFLPDPSERANISKRRWEVLMYRARSILDFLDQGHDGDVILFHFLHSLAAKLPRAHASVLHDLPHPEECRDDRLQWRRLALEYALQVHILSDETKKARTQRVDLIDAPSSSRPEQGASPSSPATSDGRHEEARREGAANYTGGSLAADVLHVLPGFFFSFDYLKNLACISSDMKRAVQDRQHWNERCISLNSVEFTDGLKLRRMTRAYMSARTVSLDLRQLPLLGEFPNSMLLEWTGRCLPQLRNLTGFESAGPLLGTAVFDVILPPNAVGMYLGVRDWGDRSGRKQSYFRFDNIYTESQTLSFTSGDLPPQLHRRAQRVSLQPQQSHRVLLRWKQDVMELIIDGVGITRIRPRESAPALPGPMAKLFLWAYVRPDSTNVAQAVRYRPVPSPIQHNASITCFLCHRDHDLCLPRWRVCPNCCTWICASHVAQNPTGMCPRCFNQLWDYVGGATPLNPEQQDSQNHCSVPVCYLVDICCYVKASRSVEVAAFKFQT